MFKCVNEAYGDNSNYDSVAEFCQMCEWAFGEAPVLSNNTGAVGWYDSNGELVLVEVEVE